MARKSIYIPDRMLRRLEEARIPINKVCQAALHQALDQKNATIANQLRALVPQIELLAQELERRAIEGYEVVAKEFGRERMESLLVDTAFMQERSAATRRKRNPG